MTLLPLTRDRTWAEAPQLRFSGHESFACRYAWLTKGYRFVQEFKQGFSNEDLAMVEMGVGKNMVRSIRFWMEVFDLAEMRADRSWQTTPLGDALFGTNGLDPYLEDVRTLWLLHWNVCVRPNHRVFAWDFLVNRWPKNEFTRAEAVAAFARESERLGYSHSAVTLEQHFDVFLHTYVSTRAGGVNAEETLDSPFVELRFIEHVGDRRIASGRREAVYAFRREAKPDITPEVFRYVLERMFQERHRLEATVSLRAVAVETYGPGQVFRLPEDDVRERLDVFTGGRSGLSFQRSAVNELLSRAPDLPRDEAILDRLLRAVYQPGGLRD